MERVEALETALAAILEHLAEPEPEAAPLSSLLALEERHRAFVARLRERAGR